MIQKGRELGGRAASLLRLLADIDLHEAARPAPALFHGLGEGGHEGRAVDGVDDVEQRHGLLGLVGLKLADKVELHIGILAPKVRPFGLRFLHPIFAKGALPRVDKGPDRILRMSFGDPDQSDVIGVTTCQRRSARDSCTNLGKPLSR